MTIQETRAAAWVPPGRATAREITMVMGAGQVVLAPTLRGLVVQEAQAAAREAAVPAIVRIVLLAVALLADQAAAQMAAPVARAEEAVVDRMDRTLR